MHHSGDMQLLFPPDVRVYNCSSHTLPVHMEHRMAVLAYILLRTWRILPWTISYQRDPSCEKVHMACAL